MNENPPDALDRKTVTPDYSTPEEFAKHYGWSPRKVREIARKLGACRILGNRMILLQTDIDAILDFSRPKPAAPSAVSRLGSGSAARLRTPEQDYEDLLAIRAASSSKKTALSPKTGGHVKSVGERHLEEK